MSTPRKYKLKKIKSGRFKNLQINLDSDYSFEKIRNRFPMLLFTPDMENLNEHYHIKLSTKEATGLRDWLNDYLKMKGVE